MNRKIIGIVKLFGDTKKIVELELVLFSIIHRHNSFFEEKIVITFRNRTSYYIGDDFHQIRIYE